MNVLIVDDEFKAREVLHLMIQHHVPQVKEIREADSAGNATRVLSEFNPRLVFLDIKMPAKDGFEWLRELDERPFDVIFTTAYDQYAIKAIRYSAFDYLLKPVDVEDLREAMQRFAESSRPAGPAYENLFYNTAQEDTSGFKLTISTNEGIHYLNPVEIVRCEADGSYTYFFLEDGSRVMASKPLGHFASLLPESLFIRSHKSHLVNQAFIRGIIQKQVLLKDGSEVEISRRRIHAVRERLSGNALH